MSKHGDDIEGKLEDWLRCENILRVCLQEMNLEFFEEEGEAAFYGPKIDIQMKFYSDDQNSKVREESISSIQLDFLSPERFNLEFINENQELKRPWIIHRAPLGSHERFIAMLLEYYDGKLPGWLSPIQLLLFPINDEAHEFAQKLRDELMEKGIRVKIDQRQSNLSKRLVLAHKLRPFSMLVIGEKEMKSKEGIIQFRDHEEKIEFSKLGDLILGRVRVPE